MSAPDSSFHALNDRQKEAVLATEGPVLVIAGAGSGKTRVLTERIAHLLRDCGIPPYEILAFTFTNKAAREMRERLDMMVPGATSALWVGTFHATGVRILRRHGERVGIRRDFSIYDADDSLGLVKSILSRSIVDAHGARSPRWWRDRFSLLKNDLITPEMALERADNTREQRMALLYAEYEKELRRANALDFDDLIARVVELFAVDEEARDVYARRFRYVLVDEFQDTNPIQMAMIDGLQSCHKNLFVVGDDDQSIYSWRGARVEHILEFEDLYSGTTLLRLEQNYRSTQTILDAANVVIANNVGRKGKNLWTNGPRGRKIGIAAALDEEAEAVHALQTVRALLEDGLALKDIAILYRTNAQSRALEDVLKMGSMPYQIIGSVKFYERMEVRDILAYCKALVNPADTVNVRRIINVPRRGIGKTTFERLELAALGQSTSVMDVLHGSGAQMGASAAKRCHAFVQTIDQLTEFAATASAPAAIEKIVEAVDYFGYLEQNYPDSDARVENVDELISAAHAFVEGAEDTSLRAFLEEVALVADVDSLDLESGMLTLMTLHNAKGLEFEGVIIIGAEEGMCPHYNSIDDEKAVEEERRLFYVGMTRAKSYLSISFAAMRRRMGQVENGIPSRFLQEIPSDCLERPLESLGTVPGAWARSTVAPGTLPFGDEAPQRHPDYESFSQEERGYEVGMRIRHESFGSGTVRRVEGSGERTRVTVLFDSGGQRKFLAHFAPMRPV